MTLSDVSFPINYEWGQSYALVFTPQLAGRLAELHAIHGSTNCVPVPLTLADGRYMLSADILTEIEPGGLLAAMWDAADKTVLLPAVEVMHGRMLWRCFRRLRRRRGASALYPQETAIRVSRKAKMALRTLAYRVE